MVYTETHSHGGGAELLEQKGIREEVEEIPSIWTDLPGQKLYSERSDAIYSLGDWETQVQVDLGPEDSSHTERLTPFLDAYHPGHNVAIEHERKEQMRARWHLLKMQAANERYETKDVDVGVLIFPTDRDPSLRRTRRELEGPFFSRHFPIHLPTYVIEYAPESA